MREKPPAISDGQARALLAAPPEGTLKGKRDRAILSVLLYHGIRRGELCALKVKDLMDRRGVKYFRIHGKGRKIRYVEAHAAALSLIQDYLDLAKEPSRSSPFSLMDFKRAFGSVAFSKGLVHP